MALKSSEKTILGIGLIAGAIAIFIMFGLPQWDAYNNNHKKETDLMTNLKTLILEKDNLNLQTTLLEKNTNIPGDVQIRTYTPLNREGVIKQLLALVVDQATHTGNQLISLAPSVATTNAGSAVSSARSLQQAPALVAGAKKAPNSLADSSASDTKGGGGSSSVHSPLLTTFDYDLGIRGSYETLQNFLKVMDHEKILIELASINMTYESLINSAPDASTSADAVANQSLPIRMTIKVRLTMQPITL